MIYLMPDARCHRCLFKRTVYTGSPYRVKVQWKRALYPLCDITLDQLLQCFLVLNLTFFTDIVNARADKSTANVSRLRSICCLSGWLRGRS